MLRRVRPKFPAQWHVPNNPKLWVTWAHANAKLARETVYWTAPRMHRTVVNFLF